MDNQYTERMRISEARAEIEAKRACGLISNDEARRFQIRLSYISRRTDISYRQKERLYAVWA